MRALGPDGTNPFADHDPRVAEPSDNPYGAPGAGCGPALPPQADQPYLPHRGPWLLILGCLAVLLAALGALALGALWWHGNPFHPLGAALLLPALALGYSAWWLGRQDLQAMAAGAMDGSGRAATRSGWLLGGCTALACLAQLTLLGAWLLQG